MPIEETDQIIATPSLLRAMRFRDVVLFLVITGFSVRFIANASVTGPSAAVVWVGAALFFQLPLALTVLELSSRYPGEGGIYVWTKQAFGGFSGFITAWTYWCSNLPYFPGILYFMAANALYLAGAYGHTLSGSPAYFVIASTLGLSIAVGLNVIGLNVGKWLHNIGALGMWLPTVILVVLSVIVWARFGSATSLTPAAFVPGTHLKDVIFWSTVAFSISGAESASMLGDEIENPRRTLPRALLIAGPTIALLFVVATIAILVALTPDHVTIISGFMDAITIFAARLRVGWIIPLCAALIAAGSLGQCGAWVAASARLPFVAGIDRYLPAAFGRLHPRWGTPHVSLLVLGGVSLVFIVLSQIGTGVSEAYNVLVSVAVITFFIPYLLMFAAAIRLQREPVPPGAFRIWGGRPVATLVAAIGFTTTAASCVLSLIPDPSDPSPLLSFTKVAGITVVTVAIGVVLYTMGAARARRAATVREPTQHAA
jgi:glutamate:GABA antiporter